jgi:hypothetical protein
VLSVEELSVAVCDGTGGASKRNGRFGGLRLVFEAIGDVVLVAIPLHCLLIARARARALGVDLNQFRFVRHGVCWAIIAL